MANKKKKNEEKPVEEKIVEAADGEKIKIKVDPPKGITGQFFIDKGSAPSWKLYGAPTTMKLNWTTNIMWTQYNQVMFRLLY